MSKHKPRDERDPLPDYDEWIRNRYNPGYFVGGRLSPLFRGMQSLYTTKEKRALRVVLLLAAASALAVFFWRVFTW